MNKPMTIYALFDPRDGMVRYVGRTLNPKQRLAAHKWSGGKGGRRLLWVSSLKTEGLEPRMIVLEIVSVDVPWEPRERHWISYFRRQGIELLNYTDGGESGPPTYAEWGKIRSEALMGHPTREETKAKIAAALKGHTVSVETRAKLSEATKAQYAAYTPEQMAEHIRKSQAATTAEKRRKCSIAAKKRYDESPTWFRPVFNVHRSWKQAYVTFFKLLYPTRTDELHTFIHAGCWPGETRRKHYGPMSSEQKLKISAAMLQRRAA